MNPEQSLYLSRNVVHFRPVSRFFQAFTGTVSRRIQYLPKTCTNPLPSKQECDFSVTSREGGFWKPGWLLSPGPPEGRFDWALRRHLTGLHGETKKQPLQSAVLHTLILEEQLLVRNLLKLICYYLHSFCDVLYVLFWLRIFMQNFTVLSPFCELDDG